MTVKERVLACQLIEAIENNRQYAKKIGVSYTLVPNQKHNREMKEKREEKNMSKFIIQMLCNGELEEDNYEGLEFDSEEEAKDYANELNSATTYGKETLQLSNRFDYEDEYDDDIEYVVAEID